MSHVRSTGSNPNTSEVRSRFAVDESKIEFRCAVCDLLCFSSFSSKSKFTVRYVINALKYLSDLAVAEDLFLS